MRRTPCLTRHSRRRSGLNLSIIARWIGRNVRRTRCRFYQRFEYVYPGPIYNVKQRLVIVPVDRYGAQQLLDHKLAADPLPVAIRQSADSIGNRVLELEVSEADRMVSFEAQMTVESSAYDLQRPTFSPADVQYTTAAEALSVGQGLCQDYAHLMLAICRAAGLPARYVSGHMLGEGGSHAWVEVFLPTQGGLTAFAIDPTNRRQPHLGYGTVAVGRDYHDVSPTSGSFTAPYGGQLTFSKRAGLTLVEYLNGDTVQSSLAS